MIQPPNLGGHANAYAAVKELNDTISSLQKQPEVLYVVAHDFYHVHMQDTLPMFNLHITITTRGDIHLAKYTQRDKQNSPPP